MDATCSRRVLDETGPRVVIRRPASDHRAPEALYGLTMGLFRRSSSPTPNQTVWPDVADAIARAKPAATILPVAASAGQQVLARIGVTERSTLGALAANTGGVVVDHGWLRILGGGCGELPDIATASDVDGGGPAHLVVGFDVLGGRFAVDGGGLGVNPGEVCYWGPDTLSWSGIGCGHSAFVTWALSGGLTEFYPDLRWAGWENETKNLGLDQGISIYPPPFTAEGRDVGAAARRPVPHRELLEFYADMARQLDRVDDGQQLRLRTVAGPPQPSTDDR